MNNATIADERGALLGWTWIATLVLLQAAAIIAGLPVAGEPKEWSVGLFFISAMFLLLGPLFVVAYFYPHKTFFFRWLLWLSERLMRLIWYAVPERFRVTTRTHPFLFAFLFTFGGLVSLLQALGVL
jgi:hypothetical protein